MQISTRPLIALSRYPILFLVLLSAFPLAAQNTSGVYGPTVKPGDKTAEYRIGWDPEAERWAQRFQYQQALTDNLRLRGVVQLRHGDGRDGLEHDTTQFQLLWQVTPNEQNWQSGVRLDLQLRDQGRPDRLRLHWANQFNLGDGWRARHIMFLVRELGDNRAAGLGIQSRSAIGKKLSDRARIDLHHFGSYGSTEDIVSFSEQTHQLGPQVSYSFDNGWKASARGLFGLNDRTSDAQFRLAVGKSF